MPLPAPVLAALGTALTFLMLAAPADAGGRSQQEVAAIATSCGTIELPATETRLPVRARGVSCRTARRVLRAYFSVDECGGNTCAVRVRGYWCATRTAAAAEAAGLGTTCRRGKARIDTVL